MTEQEYMAAVDSVVTRWQQDRTGEPLTCRAFEEAVPAHLHANAGFYAGQHGGQVVVRAPLVQHPQDWTMVWVMSHFVVHTDQDLVDVTLKQEDLFGSAFVSLESDPAEFKEWVKRYPRDSRSIVKPYSHEE